MQEKWCRDAPLTKPRDAMTKFWMLIALHVFLYRTILFKMALYENHVIIKSA